MKYQQIFCEYLLFLVYLFWNIIISKNHSNFVNYEINLCSSDLVNFEEIALFAHLILIDCFQGTTFKWNHDGLNI